MMLPALHHKTLKQRLQLGFSLVEVIMILLLLSVTTLPMVMLLAKQQETIQQDRTELDKQMEVTDLFQLDWRYPMAQENHPLGMSVPNRVSIYCDPSNPQNYAVAANGNLTLLARCQANGADANKAPFFTRDVDLAADGGSLTIKISLFEAQTGGSAYYISTQNREITDFDIRTTGQPEDTIDVAASCTNLRSLTGVACTSPPAVQFQRKAGKTIPEFVAPDEMWPSRWPDGRVSQWVNRWPTTYMTSLVLPGVKEDYRAAYVTWAGNTNFARIAPWRPFILATANTPGSWGMVIDYIFTVPPGVYDLQADFLFAYTDSASGVSLNDGGTSVVAPTPNSGPPMNCDGESVSASTAADFNISCIGVIWGVNAINDTKAFINGAIVDLPANNSNQHWTNIKAVGQDLAAPLSGNMVTASGNTGVTSPMNNNSIVPIKTQVVMPPGYKYLRFYMSPYSAKSMARRPYFLLKRIHVKRRIDL